MGGRTGGDQHVVEGRPTTRIHSAPPHMSFHLLIVYVKEMYCIDIHTQLQPRRKEKTTLFACTAIG
jgi:hypothetical protein